jgi:predicted GNAT family N-acyltransferase
VQFQHIDRLTEDQVSQLHRLCQLEWWTKGRSLADVHTMLAYSDYVFGVCEPGSDKLIAFARVLTDRVFKAFIFDVIVDRTYQGAGLGKTIMDRIVSHPDLAGVKHFELYCLPELIPFYERWGFSTKVGEIVLMRRV